MTHYCPLGCISYSMIIWCTMQQPGSYLSDRIKNQLRELYCIYDFKKTHILHSIYTLVFKKPLFTRQWSMTRTLYNICDYLMLLNMEKLSSMWTYMPHPAHSTKMSFPPQPHKKTMWASHMDRQYQLSYVCMGILNKSQRWAYYHT